MSLLDRDEVVCYLKDLRERIISGFENLETGSWFERSPWPYQKGEGGGEISRLREGFVFERAAVNWSGVSGANFPLKPEDGPFFATGVSLITHMRNPKAPTVHFNIRYIESRDQCWLGGGFDLTPMGFFYKEDKEHFHGIAKKALDPFGKELYSQFSQAAKDYFWIKHYNEERGVGGIFFDHYWTGDAQRDFEMWRSVGENFLEAIVPIYQRRIHEPYTEEDRQLLLKKRARYVEFNLLYDRGTRFGFQSGGNHEAILCSMPPLVSW
jgi:coproporphyrinogen III oxidase